MMSRVNFDKERSKSAAAAPRFSKKPIFSHQGKHQECFKNTLRSESNDEEDDQSVSVSIDGVFVCKTALAVRGARRRRRALTVFASFAASFSKSTPLVESETIAPIAEDQVRFM